MKPEPAEESRRVSRAALGLATAAGLGYLPVAPGTWGSLPGVALAWALGGVGQGLALVAALAAVVLLGTWAAGQAARHVGREDPGIVVVDEVAGQMMTLLFLPPSPRVLLAGFLLFRVLDILKPFPARSLERLPGGPGIMADDLAAGIYGNLLLQAGVHFLPGLMGVA